MSVYSKIAQVMQQVGAIKHDSKNKHQNYTYLSASKLLPTLQRIMKDVGLVCLPSITNVIISEELYLINFEFTLCDVDEPNNPVVQKWFQSIPVKARGKNNTTYIDDKAIGKAETYAQRYFFMKLFLISDGDDDDIDQTPKQERQYKVRQEATDKKAFLDKLCADPTLKEYYPTRDGVIEGLQEWYRNSDTNNALADGFAMVVGNLLSMVDTHYPDTDLSNMNNKKPPYDTEHPEEAQQSDIEMSMEQNPPKSTDFWTSVYSNSELKAEGMYKANTHIKNAIPIVAKQNELTEDEFIKAGAQFAIGLLIKYKKEKNEKEDQLL